MGKIPVNREDSQVFAQKLYEVLSKINNFETLSLYESLFLLQGEITKNRSAL